MNKKKGFTLVELIIVIVIVGILSIVAVPVYKGYTKKAMGTEAKALLGSIMTAQNVYFSEYNSFLELGPTAYDRVLDVDARGNKYFTTYMVASDGSDSRASYSACVLGNKGSGAEYISMGVIKVATNNPTFYEFYETGGFESMGITDY